MSNSLQSSTSRPSSLNEILLSSDWTDREVLMATQGSGYISSGEKPKHALANRIGRAFSKKEDERTALLATRDQLKEDVQALCFGDRDAISARFDQAFKPGARITKEAVIKFLQREGLVIPFGENETPILASGKWQLTALSSTPLNDRFKKHCEISTSSEKLEENSDACRRDIVRGLCITFDEITNKDTPATDIENEDYDIKKDPRVLQAEEVLGAVANKKFPHAEAKASVLKHELMALSHQGMLGPIMESFRDSKNSIQGFFVQGGLQPGSEYSYSVIGEEIDISLVGRIQPKQSTTTLISSAFNNRDLVESSWDHTSQGAIAIKLVATVDEETGHISKLECQSAKGTWNIQPKASLDSSSETTDEDISRSGSSV